MCYDIVVIVVIIGIIAILIMVVFIVIIVIPIAIASLLFLCRTKGVCGGGMYPGANQRINKWKWLKGLNG